MLNRRSQYLVVVIATCNRLDLLKKTLESIERGTRCSHEVIVVESGSTDGTRDYLKSQAGVTSVFLGEMLGTSRTYNHAWRQVDCAYTCWLSDDTEVAEGSLDMAVSLLERHARIGMVGLKMKDVLGPFVDRPYMGSLSAYGILNCNHGVLPMALLRELGYFNESYRSYQIDPDLTASVLCAGREVVMTQRVSVRHHRAYAVNEQHEDVKKREMAGVDNQQVYLEKFRFLTALRGMPAARIKGWVDRHWGRYLYPQGGDEQVKRLGRYPADWRNMVCGSCISLGDLVENCFRPYHLVQRIPEELLRQPGNPYRELALREKDWNHSRR